MNKIINSLSNPIVLGMSLCIICCVSILVIYITVRCDPSLDSTLRNIDTKNKIVQILTLHNCPDDISLKIADQIIARLTYINKEE